MKFFLANLSANLVALACVLFAGMLAYGGKGGWGWFLLAGVLCLGSVKLGNKD